MSELVRKGIEQAQTDLRKESDELIWQEGILRHVPLVGSIYNWISPAQKVVLQIIYLYFSIHDFFSWNYKFTYGCVSTQFATAQSMLSDGVKYFWKS